MPLCCNHHALPCCPALCQAVLRRLDQERERVMQDPNATLDATMSLLRAANYKSTHQVGTNSLPVLPHYQYHHTDQAHADQAHNDQAHNQSPPSRGRHQTCNPNLVCHISGCSRAQV